MGLEIINYYAQLLFGLGCQHSLALKVFGNVEFTDISQRSQTCNVEFTLDYR